MKRPEHLSSGIPLVLALAILAWPARSDIAIEVDVEENFVRADAIVIGTIKSKIARAAIRIDTWRVRAPKGTRDQDEEHEGIVTDFEIQIEKAYKEAPDTRLLTVTTRGGTLADGTAEVFFQRYDLEVGDEVLLFLKWEDKNDWYTPNSGQLGVYVLQGSEEGGDTGRFRASFDGPLIDQSESVGGRQAVVNGMSKQELITVLDELQAEPVRRVPPYE